jgi:long-subunit acyl-CoA synthetase (AMP-forming)
MRSIEGNKAVLPSNGKLEWERITNKDELENSLICLLYSSGTTGIPKGQSLILRRYATTRQSQSAYFITQVSYYLT